MEKTTYNINQEEFDKKLKESTMEGCEFNGTEMDRVDFECVGFRNI